MQQEKQKLLLQVIEQIKEDIYENYLEGLEELLNFIPNENLINYLSEEKLTEELTNPASTFYFAIDQEKIIGYLKVNLIYKNHLVNEEIY